MKKLYNVKSLQYYKNYLHLKSYLKKEVEGKDQRELIKFKYHASDRNTQIYYFSILLNVENELNRD